MLFVAVACVFLALGTLGQPASKNAEKVKLTVFFSTLCPDSMKFVTKQLFPTYSKHKDIMDLEIYAYGKANQTGAGNDIEFACQSGPAECDGNYLINCLKEYHTNMDQFMQFTFCIMDYEMAAEYADKCYKETGIPQATRDTVDKCRTSLEGKQLHEVAGQMQAEKAAGLYYVPWIIVNGEFEDAKLKAAQTNLAKLLDEEYDGNMEDCG